MQRSIYQAGNESKVEYSAYDLEKMITWPWFAHVVDELIHYFESRQLPFKKFMNVCLDEMSLYFS